jgi:hypothetical protein
MVSPLLREEVPGEKLRTSAERRLAANSKLLRVRVEDSKKRVATSFAWRAGTFLVRRWSTSLKLLAVCKTVSSSAKLKSSRDKTCRRFQAADPDWEAFAIGFEDKRVKQPGMHYRNR